MSRPTRGLPKAALVFVYGAITLFGAPSQALLLTITVPYWGPTTPPGYPDGLAYSAFARHY